MSGEQAAKVLERVAAVERLAAVARTLLARRVEETNQWRREGHRSAASFVAAKTSTTVGSAVGALETARRLERCPATAEAFRAGRLSEAQVREVAAAAMAEPESEHRLLEAASTVVGVAALRDECRRVRSAAAPGEGAAVAAVHRRRYLRHWTDSDGAFRADLRTTPDAGALLVAALAPQIERLRRQSAQAAVRARGDALAADALLALAADAPGDAVTPGTHPAATVQVRVDAASLVRGATVAGEVCEIPGVGPVPVATARALLPHAVLQALVTRGVDVWPRWPTPGGWSTPLSVGPWSSVTPNAWSPVVRCPSTSRSTMSRAGPSPARPTSPPWPASATGTTP